MNDLAILENSIMAAETPDKVRIITRDALLTLGQTIEKGNVEQMKANLMRYKAICDMETERLGKYVPMMFSTMWMVLGYTQQEVFAIFRGKDCPSDVRDVLNQARTMVLSDMEQALVHGSIYPSTMIFSQKNYGEMSDFPDPVKVELTDTDTMTPQEIADKYKDILE